MQIHRLTNAPFAQQLSNGCIRFGRARYYQMQEVVFADESIGDKLECVSHMTVNTVIDTTQEPTSTQVNLAKMGILSVSGNSRVTFSDTQIYKEVDCYISCWTTIANPPLKGVGADYDSRVTAAGAKTLCQYLWSHGKLQSDGLPVSTKFHSLRSGRVYYEPMNHDVAENPLPAPNPFRKRLKYSDQHEYRLVIFPKYNLGVDFITITCPEATNMLSVTQLSDTSAHANDPSHCSPHDRIHSLTAIVEEWKNRQSALDSKYEMALHGVRSQPFGDDAAHTFKAIFDAKLEEQRRLEKDFDLKHLASLRRHLFEVRCEPYNERLDKAIARGQGGAQLIRMYLMSNSL